MAFSSDVARAVAAAESGLCPPGWVGAVLIDGAVLVTAPSQESAQRVSSALETIDVEDVTDPDVVSAVLPVADILGPAWLSYLDPVGPQPPRPGGPVQHLPADHPDLLQLEGAVSAAELRESGLPAVTSDAFVVYEHDLIISAAGYQHWSHQVAHVSVLTVASARGRGLAATVAGAAVADAASRGPLPQWRARPSASRKVGAHLGFQQLGRQLSIRLH